MEPKKKISLIKIDRTSAWILLGSIIVYMLSGYGMTKGIFNSQVSQYLHRNVMPVITMIAFIGHTSLAVRTAMMRKRIWNKYTKVLLIFLYTAGFLTFIYLEVFIMRGKNDTAENTQANVVSSNYGITTSTGEYTKTVGQKTFTPEELAQYDGKDGNPAYVAVDGVVYDLTSIFKDGSHFGHLAGEELTNAFYKKHVASEITKYPVAGILE